MWKKVIDKNLLAVFTLILLQTIGFHVFFFIVKGIRFFSSWLIGGAGAGIIMVVLVFAIVWTLHSVRKAPFLVPVSDFEDFLIGSHALLCMIPVAGVWLAYRPPKVHRELETYYRVRKELESRF